MPTVGDPDGRSSEQVDAAFAQIVARFDTPVSAAEATWPSSEDLPAPSQPTGPIFPPGGPVLNDRVIDEPSLLDGLDTFGADLPEDDSEPFVRPTPPPLPRISITAILGLLTLILGVVMLVNGSLLPISASGNLLAGVVVTVAGGAMLLSRLRPGGDEDDDLPNGDGAQV